MKKTRKPKKEPTIVIELEPEFTEPRLDCNIVGRKRRRLDRRRLFIEGAEAADLLREERKQKKTK